MNLLIKANPDKDKWLQITAVVITGLLKFILVDWLALRVFYIVSACLFWLIFIRVKYKNDPSVIQEWGFQKKYLRHSFWFLLPFALPFSILILIYGLSTHTFFLNWHIIPIFFIYPMWGIIQQFIVVGLVAGNLKRLSTVKIADWQILIIVSFLFAIIHFPDIRLMIYAFAMELIFILTYFRYQNLWIPGIFHGWVSSLFLFFVMKRDLWNELLIIFR